MVTVHDMKAILGEDFFKEEVRCDYLVSAKMKRIWAVLLDMYLSFAEVCEKHGLKFFLIGGSLLGAIRHNGFIPWDDDLDVGMMRDDYEKFLSLANEQFSDPLFLQTPYTDPGYYVTWAKIRNTQTTGITLYTNHRRFNQGLFLDIFPIDYVDISNMEKDYQEIYSHAKRCGAFMRQGSKYLNELQKQEAIIYHTDNPLHEWEMVQKVASNPNYKGSSYLANAVFTGYGWEKMVHPTSGYETVEKHVFEGLDVFIPSGYHELLSIQFGDYMTFPPMEQRGIRHSFVIFDPDKPYTDYTE